MRIQEMIRHDCLDDETLGFLRAISVDQIQMDLRFGSVTPGGPLLEDELRQGRDFTDYFGQLRDRVEAHGLSLEAAVMRCWPEICLAAEDRDAKIEAWCQMVRSLGQVGVHYLGWAFKPMGNFRTTAAVGRGGARYSTFDYEELMASGDRSMHQPEVAAETMWQSLEHFLAAVVPVAEAAGVRLALHPDDPPIPEPLAGVAQITSTLEQFRRILFEIAPSDHNRMLFCQGCMTELLGADGVYAAIEEMAASGKIGFVHFRNVAGAGPRFREVFIDEGEVDMPRAMRLYRDNGYEGSFMMDHTPHFAGSHDELRGKAFAVGYIRALIQQVYG